MAFFSEAFLGTLALLASSALLTGAHAPPRPHYSTSYIPMAVIARSACSMSPPDLEISHFAIARLTARCLYAVKRAALEGGNKSPRLYDGLACTAINLLSSTCPTAVTHLAELAKIKILTSAYGELYARTFKPWEASSKPRPYKDGATNNGGSYGSLRVQPSVPQTAPFVSIEETVSQVEAEAGTKNVGGEEKGIREYKEYVEKIKKLMAPEDLSRGAALTADYDNRKGKLHWGRLIAN